MKGMKIMIKIFFNFLQGLVLSLKNLLFSKKILLVSLTDMLIIFIILIKRKRC